MSQGVKASSSDKDSRSASQRDSNPVVGRRYAHEMRAGEDYAPLEFSVTSELNQQFLYALEDFGAAYLRSPDGEPAIIHPVILLHMSARTRSPSFVLAPNMGSVFASDRVDFCNVARVGDQLRVSWKIRDVYERRGKLYQALSTEIRNSSDEQILTREAHSVFFMRDQTPFAPRGEGR